MLFTDVTSLSRKVNQVAFVKEAAQVTDDGGIFPQPVLSFGKTAYHSFSKEDRLCLFGLKALTKSNVTFNK